MVDDVATSRPAPIPLVRGNTPPLGPRPPPMTDPNSPRMVGNSPRVPASSSYRSPPGGPAAAPSQTQSPPLLAPRSADISIGRKYPSPGFTQPGNAFPPPTIGSRSQRGGAGSTVDVTSSVAYVDDQEAYDAISSSNRRAAIIARYADEKSLQDEKPEALVLYVKALGLYGQVINAVKEFRASKMNAASPRSAAIIASFRSGSDINVDYQSGELSPRLTQTLKLLGQMEDTCRYAVSEFQTFFKRMQRVQEDVQLLPPKGSRGPPDVLSTSQPTALHHSPNSLGSTPRDGAGSYRRGMFSGNAQYFTSVSAEKLLYDWGLQMTKDAAVDELMERLPAAERKYKKAYRVFEQLSLEPTADDHDKAVLHHYMSQVYARLESLRNALDAGANFVS